MTHNKKKQDLLYFKGVINKYHIKINVTDNEDDLNDLKVILSIFK